jgi:hypothetical protein
MTVLEQGVKELMQKLEETCTEMQQGAENHICEGGSKLMLQLLQYYVEITPRRELLAMGDDRTWHWNESWVFFAPLKVCRFCMEEEDPPSVMPVRRALQISVVLEDALGGDSRGASGMMIIIRCRGRCQMVIMQLAAYALDLLQRYSYVLTEVFEMWGKVPTPTPHPPKKKRMQIF